MIDSCNRRRYIGQRWPSRARAADHARMSGTFTAVDLSRLPFPSVVEPLDFETIFSAMLTDLRARMPAFSALVESDPAYKLLEVAAYRELMLRQRVNDAAKAVTLAYATGSNLDHLAANFNVTRLLLDAGDPDAFIPRPPIYEADADLRRRVQLAFEGLSTAGPVGAYVFHALGASPDVADVAAISDTPGIVDIYVLSRGASGTPAPAVLAAVEATLTAENVRPLTDQVRVFPAPVIPYTVEADIEVFSGPDGAVVAAAADAAVQQYVEQMRRIGLPVARSGLFAALHQPGVRNVTLSQPAADISVNAHQVAICTGVYVEAH